MVLRHNGGFYNTCTLKRCLHRKVDFKTNATYNAHASQLFPLQSRIVTKGLYYFKLSDKRKNSLKLDAVTKQRFFEHIVYENKVILKYNGLVLRPLSDDDVMLHVLLSTPEYDVPFQSAGIAGSTVL